MNIRFRLLLLCLLFFGLTQFNVSGQSECSTAGILAEPDLLTVERGLSGCRGSTLDSILNGAQTALDAAQFPEDIARYRTILALVYTRQDDNFDARITMQDALLDWRDAADSVMEGRVLYYLGGLFYDIKQYDQGNAFYSQGMNVARRNGDTFTQGRITLAYGKHELAQEHNENALAQFEAALPLLLQNPLIAVPEQIEESDPPGADLRYLRKTGHQPLQARAGELFARQPGLVSGSGRGSRKQRLRPCRSQPADGYSGGPARAAELPGRDPAFLDDVQFALDESSEAADRARLQSIAGLIYSAKGDDYNASLSHERALVGYREAGDRDMESWTLYYMAQAYDARNQSENVPTYLGQAQQIASSLNDSFQLGRVRLMQAEYEIAANGDYSQAALLEEEGLQHLQAAGDIARPEQIEMLQLMNRTYSVLGDLERAGQYLRQGQGLRGQTQQETAGSSLVDVTDCELTNLVNQFDVVYVERQLSRCRNNLAGLVFTAETMVANADDPYVRGIAQSYVGMGHYLRGGVLTAYLELDKAVTILRQVGDPRLLGFAYYYLAKNEYDAGQWQQATDYYDLARRSWEQAGDNFNLGRVYLQLGLWESKNENWDTGDQLSGAGTGESASDDGLFAGRAGCCAGQVDLHPPQVHPAGTARAGISGAVGRAL